MDIQHYFLAIAGGMLAGIAAARMIPIASWLQAGLGGNGRQSALIAGLMAGGAILTWLDPAALPMMQAAPIEFMAAAGVLAGVGAQMKVARTRPSEIPADRGTLRASMKQVACSSPQV